MILSPDKSPPDHRFLLPRRRVWPNLSRSDLAISPHRNGLDAWGEETSSHSLDHRHNPIPPVTRPKLLRPCVDADYLLGIGPIHQAVPNPSGSFIQERFSPPIRQQDQQIPVSGLFLDVFEYGVSQQRDCGHAFGNCGVVLSGVLRVFGKRLWPRTWRSPCGPVLSGVLRLLRISVGSVILYVV
jgi:hypothetical protein